MTEKWSPEEVEILIPHINSSDNLHIQQLLKAAGYDRTPQQIANKKKYISRDYRYSIEGGIPCSEVLTPVQCEKMRHFLSCLATQGRLAKEAGKVPNVTEFMKRYAIEYGRGGQVRSRNPLTDDLAKKITALHRKKMSVNAISKALNVSYNKVKYLVQQLPIAK